MTNQSASNVLSNQTNRQNEDQGINYDNNRDKNDDSQDIDHLSSYYNHITKLKHQLNLIKNKIQINSKDLLQLEQKRLENELKHEELTQSELLRHQTELKKHNMFMTEQYNKLKPKEIIISFF